MRLFLLLLQAALVAAVTGASGVVRSPVSLSVVTWNLAQSTPSKRDAAFLKEHEDSDVVVVGVQECENLKPRRQEGHRSRAWRQLSRQMFGRSMRRVCDHKLQGMHISMFAKPAVSKNIKIVGKTDVPCGVGNVLGNKGAACIFAEIASQRLVFINAHLPAHPENVGPRLAAIARIMREVEASLPLRWRKRRSSDGGGSSSSGLDAVDGIVFFGDLNSRLDLPRLEAELAVVQLIELGGSDWQDLLDYDQLQRQLTTGEALHGFREHEIKFPPTFKYDSGSDRLDSSPKRRAPAWTDRILYKNRFPSKPCLHISSYDAAMHVRHGDHRPVHARFAVRNDLP